LVTYVPETDEGNAAGNGGVFSLLAGTAIGCAFAGLFEFTRTFGAFSNLQFTPTDATEPVFVSWTWAMLASPAVVIASSIVIALALVHVRTRPALAAGAIGIITTIWMAARVWENVTGYLIPSDAGPPIEDVPLPPARWPIVYQHGIAVLIAGVVLCLAAIGYALWRTRPRAIAFAAGVLLALAIVFTGGQFGFAAMAFLRLRNLSVAVAVIDLAMVALMLRARRFDLLLLLCFLLAAASAWRLDQSWRTMLAQMPHGIETPAW